MGAAKKTAAKAADPKAALAKSKADAAGYKCLKCMQVRCRLDAHVHLPTTCRHCAKAVSQSFERRSSHELFSMLVALNISHAKREHLQAE